MPWRRCTAPLRNAAGRDDGRAFATVYELHVATKAGIPVSPISLHYRARLTQSMGEDWTSVKLALSTVNMDPTNQTIPVLSPTKIQPPADVEPQLPLPQPHSL